MSLEKVVEDVLDQAKKQAEKIVLDAGAEAGKIISEAERKAVIVSKELSEKNMVLALELEKKEFSSAKLKANKDFFEAKKEILDEINALAFKKVSELSGEKRNSVLKHLAEKALRELDGAEFFYSTEKDKVLIQKFFPKLKHAGGINSVGGLVLENSSRNIRVNCTFEVLFDSVKGDCLNEIASRVF